MIARYLPLAILAMAAACTPAQTDGIDPDGKPFDAVAADETITLVGTEPFWSLEAQGGTGIWSTPENQPGTQIAITRFSGNGGMGLSGTLDGKSLTATITPGTCSDGMSDRVFPFVATIALGAETLQGCGYTTSQPFTGPAAP